MPPSPSLHAAAAADVDFWTGFNVGGGAAYQLNEHVTLRGSLNFARAEARTGDLALMAIDGKKFNRYLYDVDLQLRYPLRGCISYRFRLR